MLLQLKPLIVVTGAVHVEGGDKHVVRQKRRAKNGEIDVQHTRQITPDRRAGNVISTGYMRRIERIRVLRTPFGHLIDPEKLADVKALITSATRDVGEFNERMGPAATSRLTNCMLWEHLRGNRLAAVQGWLQRQIVEKNEAVMKVIPVLETVS